MERGRVEGWRWMERGRKGGKGGKGGMGSGMGGRDSNRRRSGK